MDDPSEVGDWARISHLGSGGFGIVTLWRNNLTNQFIAVKKCKWSQPNQITKRQRERWCNEVEMMQSMKNENIVNYVPLPEKLGITLNKYNPCKLPILSMEYCSKGNLRHLLALPENSCGLQEPDVKTLLLDLINGVSYLHSLKITHRDLKPENVVLQRCDTRPNKVIYKVIDLGYAKEIEAAGASFVGTLQYLAPEIFTRENYNSTVDYWSLGIVVFEVICGIHPFLPHLPPPQRFQYLKEKKQCDIYLYLTDNESIKYSSELLKENHISTCLKENIEKWLRTVLQFDPKDRISPTGNVFDDLKNVLRKKYVTVFSVFTYEIYSYEINDCTLLSTLQDWFARDTKVNKNDQVVLCKGNFTDDNTIDFHDNTNRKVIDCFDEDNPESFIVIFKKNAVVNENVLSKNFPKRVKQMFTHGEKVFTWEQLKPFYIHSIYYIAQESKLLQKLISSFQQLMQYFEKHWVVSKSRMEELKTKTNNLLVEISCYDRLNCKTNVSTDLSNDRLRRNLRTCREELLKTKDTVFKINKLIRKHDKVNLIMSGFNVENDKVLKELDRCDMKPSFEDAVLLLNKKKKTGKSYPTQDMLKIVNTTIKNKHAAFKKSTFSQYLLDIWQLHDFIQRFSIASNNLVAQVALISERLCENEAEKLNIIYSTSSKENNSQVTYNSYISISTDEIIADNMSLRYEVQDKLNESLLLHRSIVQEIEESKSPLPNGFKETIC